MTDQPEELFAAVDSLLAAVDGGTVLPAPAERVRLREAAGLTQAAVAQALGVRVPSITAWEAGRAEPKGERLEAYRRLLEGLAHRYPAPATHPGSGPAAQPPPPPLPQPAPGRAAGEAAPPVRSPYQEEALDTTSAPAPFSPAPQGQPSARPTSRRPAAKKAAPKKQATVDPRFPHGPLAVLDGDGTAYCTGGILLQCPATTIPQLVEWTLKESGIGAARLHRNGKDSDPLIVLTASAAVKLGLPERLEGFEARRSLRLEEDHPVV
ncbi:helix-turn-helix domain-containing protein, partial [Streptomyces sp. 8N706]|uniref:helix-turn-helix domain-containing protein n=1 Tax=Streptomyces sp. 8N706 TaxID=3457416 RepID=UPI003FCFBAED